MDIENDCKEKMLPNTPSNKLETARTLPVSLGSTGGLPECSRAEDTDPCHSCEGNRDTLPYHAREVRQSEEVGGTGDHGAGALMLPPPLIDGYGQGSDSISGGIIVCSVL